jgi:hypothetical protein
MARRRRGVSARRFAGGKCEVRRLRGSLVAIPGPGVGPAGAFCVSLEEGDRAAFREAFRARLAVGEGPFTLTARAWSVVGETPVGVAARSTSRITKRPYPTPNRMLPAAPSRTLSIDDSLNQRDPGVSAGAAALPEVFTSINLATASYCSSVPPSNSRSTATAICSILSPVEPTLSHARPRRNGGTALRTRG